MKASDLFVKCLEAEGVERIYGVPGEENADIMLSLMDSSIEFILCRHEQAAAFAADVYGRLTGKPGLCLGTLGPGATNLVTGVADANMDRAPLICLLGQASTTRLHKESHQNMDSIAMYEPISKWASSITHERNIPETVRKAFKIAQQEKPGATIIELPEDLAKRDVKGLKPLTVNKTRRAAADWKGIDQALKMIVKAKNPIILAGNGAVRKRASDQLHRLVRKTGIAVVNTFMGKGAIPRNDPHCLFTLGLQGRDHVNAAIDAADVIISVGYDLVEFSPEAWNKHGGKKIIHIDFWPAEIDDAYTVDVEIVADVADALWQLNEEINKRYEHKMPIFDISKRAKLRKRIQDDFAMEKNSKAFPMKPQKILWDVKESFLVPRTFCCQTSAPTKCGSRATTNATNPTPA